MNATNYQTKEHAFRTIPPALQEGLLRYLVHHVPTGSFLQAVLENDLRGAMRRGDLASVGALYAIVFYLENAAQSRAWGSKDNYRHWCTERRYNVRGYTDAGECVLETNVDAPSAPDASRLVEESLDANGTLREKIGRYEATVLPLKPEYINALVLSLSCAHLYTDPGTGICPGCGRVVGDVANGAG